MNFFKSFDLRLCALFVVLVFIACGPIWSVEYYINQDGSPHLYNGYLLIELLKGNAFHSQLLQINPVPLPNSSGHWLIVGLLSLFPPFIVTKLVVTITYAGFVAAVVWLRFCVAGRDGLKTSMLIGAAIAFNWIWLLGFYNFLIGTIAFIFTTGLIYLWREQINLMRAVVLSVCVLVVYLSHIVPFIALGLAFAFQVLFSSRDRLVKNLLWLMVFCLPVLPLIILYKLASESGGGFSPNWSFLTEPLSVSAWVKHVLAADPFILISRRMIPFSTSQSSSFAILAPSVWIVVAFLLLTIATVYKRSREFFLSKEFVQFFVLLVALIGASLAAPDDFGPRNGAILRPRLLLCGLCFVVPLFRTDTSFFLKRVAQLCLLFVLIFQSFAIWDFARQHDIVAREFLSAGTAIQENESVASVMIIEDGKRFHALPETQAVTLLGLNRNIFVWDNYELGYYLFPIQTKERSDREFIFELATSHGFILNDPADVADFDNRLAQLKTCLLENHTKINKLLLWGRDERVEAVLAQWFDREQIYQQGRIRIFKHK